MLSDAEKRVDIGLHTSAVTLAHKLEHAAEKSPEATWNRRGLPKRLGQGTEPDRLDFATGGYWRGYFRLSTDLLWNPEDEEKPYSLLFDTASGTPIDPVPVKRFRGFRDLDNMPAGRPD